MPSPWTVIVTTSPGCRGRRVLPAGAPPDLGEAATAAAGAGAQDVAVLYLGGVAAAASLFELPNTYVIKSAWILTAEVTVPAVAPVVTISETATYAESPRSGSALAVLSAYGLAAGVIGTAVLRRRDVT